MELRGLRPNTIYTFTNCARRFLAHVGRAPTTVTTENVEGFLLDLARQQRSPRTRNVYLAAIRCLLAATLGDAGRVITAAIPSAKPVRRCPEILSGTEVARLLDATTSPKYRAIPMLAYGAGLRIGEVFSVVPDQDPRYRFSVRCLRLVILCALLAGACASSYSSRIRGDLLRRASFDFHCASSALVLTELSSTETGFATSYGVRGCGQQAVYLLNSSEVWVLNTNGQKSK